MKKPVKNSLNTKNKAKHGKYKKESVLESDGLPRIDKKYWMLVVFLGKLSNHKSKD